MGFSQDDILSQIPQYLHQFIMKQDYDSCYTARDQAVWRFTMRQLSNQLKQSAHPEYLEGLRKTGVSIEEVPSVEEMNKCLNVFGWKAVVVDGFIPPQAFMEFQMQKILPIALDMRSIGNILYTPAPDIVHESAGHAPIIADEEYSVYLQRFGAIGMKAMFNKEDKDVYEAIRKLSILKEYPDTTETDIKLAEKELNKMLNSGSEPSEAALLTRLHWWTVEYGLVGSPENYTIYGAGLLSSLGESRSCLDDEKVKKLTLTVDAVNTSYDITNPQPQLFVTKSCRHLTQVLEDYADQMCFRKGGAESVQKAIDSEIISTVEYSSGLQVSGLQTRLIQNSVGKEIYIGTTGSTQLAYQDTELDGHGISYHAEGFGSPVGHICNLMKPLEEATEYDLITLNIKRESNVTLEFVSGITVKGYLKSIIKKDDKLILMSFENCTVTGNDGSILFDPAWGMYDMAIGKNISSVFSGSADRVNFDVYPPKSDKETIQVTYSDDEKVEFKLYEDVRAHRELNSDSEEKLHFLKEQIDLVSPRSWLLYIELLEMAVSDSLFALDLRKTLQSLSAENVEISHLIERGIALIEIENAHV